MIVGIGQGYFLATPLELASSTATLAAKGKRYAPRILQAIQTSEREEPQPVLPARKQSIPVTNINNWNHIIDAMTRVIDGPHGTAKVIRTDKYKIAGKTGTAQVFSIAQDESTMQRKLRKSCVTMHFFISFAPANNPKIAVAVIVENGGSGSSVAAPIAKRIMDLYLLGQNQ